jgi:peroxiredoxin
MISVGETAPAFELPGSDGETVQKYALSDFIEEGMVLLTFYPFDFSPTCTGQLCEFRDAEMLTFTDGVDIVGISVDSAYAHERFIQEFELIFPLVSDRMATVAEQYGFREDEIAGHPNVCQRGLVAVDSSQTVRYVWRPSDGQETPSISDLEDAIAWYRQGEH